MNEDDEIVLKDRDKITNYNEDEVLKIVNVIKDNVRFERFKIATGANRKDNEDLIKEFNLTNEKIKKILLSIGIKDFCYGTHDDKDKKTVLYVFAKETNVYEITDIKIMVNLYIKIKITKQSPKFILVISLHKLKYQIDHLFK